LSKAIPKTFRLKPELVEKLDLLAAHTNRSKTYLVEEALTNYLEREAWQIAEIAEAVAEADAGGPFVEHEKVDAWLRSWGTDDEEPSPSCE
jgi:predicted transcriptional regulator